MARGAVRIRIGRPKGLKDVEAQLGAQVAKQAAEAAIRRVAKRMNDHPSGREVAAQMKVVGVNQYSADIQSPRGNPGVIPAYRNAQGLSRWGKKAMVWPGGGPVRWVRNYRGVGPLIKAETARVTKADIDISKIRIK